jgi:hypothetical protein
MLAGDYFTIFTIFNYYKQKMIFTEGKENYIFCMKSLNLFKFLISNFLIIIIINNTYFCT